MEMQVEVFFVLFVVFWKEKRKEEREVAAGRAGGGPAPTRNARPG